MRPLVTWIAGVTGGSLWIGTVTFYFLRARRENREAVQNQAARVSADLIHSDRDLAEVVKTYPTSKLAAMRYAEWAERRKDWDEAVRRWTAMTERLQNDPDGYIRWGGALLAAGRFDEADAILLQAQRRFRKRTDIYTVLAWVPQGRKDWPEAARRWAIVRDKRPSDIAGYIHGATALREAGRLEDAAQLLDVARRRFPDSEEVKALVDRQP